MYRTIAVATLFAASPAWANFAKCIIDKVPGAANDVAASAIYQVCMNEFPGGLQTVQQGSGRGWFGFKSGAECVADKAKTTQSPRGAMMINGACRRLYDEANYFDQFDKTAPQSPTLKPFTGKLDGER